MRFPFTPIYFILLICSTLLFSCHDDTDALINPDNGTDNPGTGTPDNTKKLKLTKIEQSGGDTYVFNYNTAGLVLRKTLSDPQSGIVTEYEYDGTKNLIQVNTYGRVFNKFYYENNTLIKGEEYNGNWVLSTFYYQFNAHKQLEELVMVFNHTGTTYPNDVKDLKFTFEYNAQGNLIKETEYKRTFGNPVYTLSSTLTYSDFDNKKTVMDAASHEYLMPLPVQRFVNNPRRIEYSAGTVNRVNLLTYEYNSNNYPVKRTVNSTSNSTGSYTSVSIFTYAE